MMALGAKPPKVDWHSWLVACETDQVLSPDTVRESRAFFEELALRHGGRYNGWEARLDSTEINRLRNEPIRAE
jgi:hypothetical protein